MTMDMPEMDRWATVGDLQKGSAEGVSPIGSDNKLEQMGRKRSKSEQGVQIGTKRKKAGKSKRFGTNLNRGIAKGGCKKPL